LPYLFLPDSERIAYNRAARAPIQRNPFLRGSIEDQKMAENISLKLDGAPIINPRLPAALRPATRAVGGAQATEFLPDGYLKINAAFDVSTRARSTPGGSVERKIAAADDEVVVLEMADGVTVITSAKKLKESLQRIDPQSVDADGALKLNALRERGEATRGIIGDAASELVSRVFTLTVGAIPDPIVDAAKRAAAKWLGEEAEEKILAYPDLGVTWLGTKAPMWAIENQLERKPGLYQWPRGAGEAADLLNIDETELAKDAKDGPLLVFVHGTASSSLGSFGDLQKISADDWQALQTKFGDRIYAFEHRTFSESPIDNAVELAAKLPKGARINLVAHSRGGLIGDLLCLEDFGDDLIDGFRAELPEPGDVSDEERERVRSEAGRGHEEQRARLRDLRKILKQKQFIIQRYARVGCPARGTMLASGNLDIFLSALLTLIGRVPYLYGNPLYYACKRIVLEIVKNRTNAKLVPGLEAMLPDSPMTRFLATAKPQTSTQLGIIAGDIEGGGLLKRLGVLFTDYAFFSGIDNDLVVDTDSMYAGIAPRAGARALFEQSPATSHFHYFQNAGTREALRDWLVVDDLERLKLFTALPVGVEEPTLAEERSRALSIRRRGGDADADTTLPVVVVLPGIMGSHLWKNNDDRIWFDPADIATGGLKDIRWRGGTGSAEGDGITAEKLFDMSYGDLCEHLMSAHQVERFAYDWRLPLDILADRLGGFLRKLLDDTKNPERPIRLLAHSMGGLVARSLVHKSPELWNEIMSRDSARFVMLGTPNQGAHSMVEALIGKSDTLRTLARLDLANDLQTILDIIGEFRGALQLLPKPGFEDVGGAQFDDYFTVERWRAFKEDLKDFWFGEKVAAVPSDAALSEGRWLWDRDGSTPALPETHRDKTIYVHGCAPITACGIKKVDEEWKMVGTAEGDGTVTWASGAVGGIGRRYYMPAVHGDLANTDEYFSALDELLRTGATNALADRPPAARAVNATKPMTYEAGAPRYPTPEEAAHALMGRSKRKRLKTRPVAVLKLGVKAMDLRFVSQPIMVGHYEQDAISGAEAIIDRDLVDRALSERRNLGLYAGPIGSAVVVLRLPNEAEQSRGSLCGAVVTGLGKYDGTLAANTLTEAVRTGAMRYLLQYVDCSGRREGAIALSTLLLGYNSTANLTISASVEALIRGVVEANFKFKESTNYSLRIGSLEIVELYIDSAISAMHALSSIAAKLNGDLDQLGVRLEVPEELDRGPGIRQRLDDGRTVAYWPRMIITDADDKADPSADDSRDPAARGVTGETARPSSAIATRLRFVHVGQRARAETIVQQRQPGLVETLVAQQIQLNDYRPEFCRSLFQLMVPQDFKDAARELDRIVLVLDGYTANLPWELMLAEQEPLAVRARVIRQLSSTVFRRQVRQSLQPLAYVVGNPSTENFFKTFPHPHFQAMDGLDSLAGAEEEAGVVVETLGRQGYRVESSIGQGCKALDVITRLYQQPYRIVHIAAHGLFEQPAADGIARTGVVLSDGMLLGAAEIGQMEIVPDLVFLNCCHLAQSNPTAVAYNRLAYSISRELIEIGVRCVIAAGWAVDDDAAYTFAETFYRGILQDQLQFGDAVFEARRDTYRRHGRSITWGAYQAYGDASWRVDPRAESSGRVREMGKLVAVEELIDQTDRIRMGIYRRREAPTKADAQRISAELKSLLSRCPRNWLDQPAVNFELAQTYALLGGEYFADACRYYVAAVAAEDRLGRVPVAAIEQLANLEARLGESMGQPARVDRAIERLRDLDKATGDSSDETSAKRAVTTQATINAERAALVGAAYKRKAAIYARAIVAGKQNAAGLKQFNDTIRASIEAYSAASGPENHKRFDPYPALNWLALKSLDGRDAVNVEVSRRCAKIANESFHRSPGVWQAIMAADAVLTESLCDGILNEPGSRGEQALDKVWKRYADSLANLPVVPKDLDSLTEQLSLLALFFDAKGKPLVARRLVHLAGRLRPGDVRPSEASKMEVSGDKTTETGRPRPRKPRRKKK
jgi:CHAT domain-containing protein/pimeloyl-ACP methyl ester carboxylesterase